ncbi:MAG: TraR/DksA C4-type zinc finger protein [Planctomycetes bacterium]|nr:TraR/DksA C4-type zinc finger protein [Planctomycetota bacterium]
MSKAKTVKIEAAAKKPPPKKAAASSAKAKATSAAKAQNTGKKIPEKVTAVAVKKPVKGKVAPKTINAKGKGSTSAKKSVNTSKSPPTKTTGPKTPGSDSPKPLLPQPSPTVTSGESITGGFASSGVHIKTAPQKPVLSIASEEMVLRRSSPAKPELTHRPSDRKLSQNEQQEIKNRLLEKRERLLAGMRRELAIQKERAESKVADEVDKATDAYDEDLSFEIATANDQELEEIQVALEKIEKGTYGECENCGCAISISRLEALPSATACVSCRDQEEKARRRDDGLPTFNVIGSEEGEGETELL